MRLNTIHTLASIHVRCFSYNTCVVLLLLQQHSRVDGWPPSQSAAEYATRARHSRCFCPPEILIPRSPISVRSPAGSARRSGSSPVTRSA